MREAIGLVGICVVPSALAQNGTVQPAAEEEVSIGETLDPPFGCNGLFVALRCGVRGASFTTLRPD